MSCCCCPLTLAAVALVAFGIYKYFFSKCCKNAKKEVLEKNYKKDVVYLYQFNRARTVPSLSPFCLKLETFLRIHNIEYENRFVMFGRSKYGLLPFIELNGEHIADSQIVEERLKQHFNIKPLPSTRDEAVSRAITRMVDQHTVLLCIKYKILDNPEPVVAMIFEASKWPAYLKSIISPIACCVLKCKVSKRLRVSLGLFSDSEFQMLLRKDLDTIRDLLGEQKFLFGDKPTSADCTVFGHLATMCCIPSENGVNRLVKSDYPTITEYIENVKKEVFPDDFELKD